MAGWNAELIQIVDAGRHCTAHFEIDERTRVDLDIGAGGSFLSGSLLERQRRNERRSEPQEVRALGDDALWMTGGPIETIYAVFDGVELRIDVPPGTLDQEQTEELLDRIWERREVLEGYRH